MIFKFLEHEFAYQPWNSFSLLGGSQTFMGTLATIVFLFVFANKSNFIFFLLSEVVNNIQDELRRLRAKTDLSEFMNSKKYKVVASYNGDDLDLKLRIQEFTSDVELDTEELKSMYLPKQEEADGVLKKIRYSKELVLAPVYTFLLCLIVFCFDEALRSPFVGHVNIMVSILAVFMVFSYIFWGHCGYTSFYMAKGW